MGEAHLQFMLIYFALENLILKDKFLSSKNTPQDTVCNAIIIPGIPDRSPLRRTWPPDIYGVTWRSLRWYKSLPFITMNWK